MPVFKYRFNSWVECARWGGKLSRRTVPGKCPTVSATSIIELPLDVYYTLSGFQGVGALKLWTIYIAFFLLAVSCCSRRTTAGRPAENQLIP